MLYLFVVEYFMPTDPQTSHLRRRVDTRRGEHTEIAAAGLETKGTHDVLQNNPAGLAQEAD